MRTHANNLRLTQQLQIFKTRIDIFITYLHIRIALSQQV